MTVLRARAVNAQGQPVQGRTATLEPYEANRYVSPYSGGPGQPRGLPATSGADGWLSWTLPDLLRRPGPKGTYWLITGLETQPVVAATQPGDGTVTLDQRRIGTLDAKGNLVVPPAVDTAAAAAAAAAAAQASTAALTTGAPTALDTFAEVAAGLGAKQDKASLGTDVAASTAVKAAFGLGAITPKIPSSSRLAGTVVGWCGDSITVGTGATSSANYFRTHARNMLGARVSTASINGGVAGERSDQLLARMDGIIASGAQFLSVLIGTNDAGQSVPVATFQANIAAIKAKADAAGLPIAFGTVPPRSSGASATTAGLITAYNLWLRFWCAQNGVPLIGVHAALVDRTTGFLAAANDSGDGTHPSNAGHKAIATAIATVLGPLLPLPSWPVVTAGPGLINDPLMTSVAGWTTVAGTNTTKSLVPASGGDLPAGQWVRHTIDNTAGASTLTGTIAYTMKAGQFAVGDVLLLAMYIRGSSLTAINKVGWYYTATAQSLPLDAPGLTTPGPLLRIFTVPAGTGTFRPGFIISAGAGEIATVDVGAFDVFNLTTLGLAGMTI